MRFLGFALLLLSAAVLANAAVGRQEDDEDQSGHRYRLFKRSPEQKAEGRTLSQLLSFKGNCAQNAPTITTISPSPSSITGTSDIIISPSVPNDDVANFNGVSMFRRGNGRPGQALTVQEYEIRRQAEENKQLRERIEILRRQNIQNRRRAQQIRRQQLMRSRNQRRRSNLRNRNARRRIRNRNRNARRRLRRNRRRN
ncbi:troponin T, cardiac muscle-like [Drosophila hydei]|uniref:Troponin T, cardiac muscle-like n=1 Tax=Drosophila hydei TaxID=7224 RepID=A0A6J2SVM3_DROHY|nr:troponin T, cardiac muscle-like [Drosophila hydei]